MATDTAVVRADRETTEQAKTGPRIEPRRWLALARVPALLLAVAASVAGCLDPVAVDPGNPDAADTSVVFVPDTPSPKLDVQLTELGNPDVLVGTDVVELEVEDTVDTGPDALVDDADTDTSATDADLADTATETDGLAGDATPTGEDGDTAIDDADTSEQDTADSALSDVVTATDGQDDSGPEDDLLDTGLADTTEPDGADAAVDVADPVTPTICGDLVCDVTETCAGCPADCGTCPIVCGDNVCDLTESCENCPDDCGLCPGPICSLMTSVGCLQGEQCFPDGGLNLCWPGGQKLHGEACGSFDACAVGSLCVGGTCRSLCDTAATPGNPVCLAGVPCDTLVGGNGPLAPNLGACRLSANCNTADHSGCASGEVCLVEGSYKVCTVPGIQGVGTACTTSYVCAKGLVCVEGAKGSDPTLPGVCRPYCDDSGTTCSSGSCWPALGPDGKSNGFGIGGCLP
jgi:hypothetical protein